MQAKRLFSALLAAALCAGTLPVALAADTPAEPAAAAQNTITNRREDLAFLLETLGRVHPQIYANSSRQAFADKRAGIEAGLEEMSDFDFAIALSELVALVGDSHTGVNVGVYADQLHFVAMDTAHFAEGWVVTALPAEHAALLGGVLTEINGIPMDEVQARISPMIGADNPAYERRQFGGLVYVYEILQHYGIADDPSGVALTIRTADGEQTVSVPALTRPEMAGLQVVSLASRVTGAPATAADTSKLYFAKALDGQTLYIQYNACREDEALPMETFTAQVAEQLEQGQYTRVLLDLRNNGGGSDGVAMPLLWMLSEKHDQDGVGFYTLIGEGTFSSALINAVESKEMGATIVGTPTGGSVDHFGAVSSFSLPHSGIRVQYSTKFIDMGTLISVAEPYGVESLRPDIAAEQTLTDYLAGKDTAVGAILARTETGGARTELTRGALAAALARDWASRTGNAIGFSQPPFDDVSTFHYTAPYVGWAEENGLMVGAGGGSFRPDRTVTRQELAAVLARYAALTGLELAGEPAALADAGAVDAWALEAARALTGAGLFDLTEGRFDPTGPVTRDALAQILKKL